VASVPAQGPGSCLPTQFWNGVTCRGSVDMGPGVPGGESGGTTAPSGITMGLRMMALRHPRRPGLGQPDESEEPFVGPLPPEEAFVGPPQETFDEYVARLEQELQASLKNAQNEVKTLQDQLDTLEAEGADVETLREAGGKLNDAVNHLNLIEEALKSGVPRIISTTPEVQATATPAPAPTTTPAPSQVVTRATPAVPQSSPSTPGPNSCPTGQIWNGSTCRSSVQTTATGLPGTDSGSASFPTGGMSMGLRMRALLGGSEPEIGRAQRLKIELGRLMDQISIAISEPGSTELSVTRLKEGLRSCQAIEGWTTAEALSAARSTLSAALAESRVLRRDSLGLAGPFNAMRTVGEPVVNLLSGKKKKNPPVSRPSCLECVET